MNTSSVQYGSLPLQVCNGVIYFIGDVHNEAAKLQDLLSQILPSFTSDDHIVFLGDLLDRGPDAAGTVELLVALNRKHPGQIFFVKGNHDFMLQHYLSTGKHTWMKYLKETLESFQAKWGLPDTNPDTVMQALIDKGFSEIASKFLPYYETEHTIGTHAPLDMTTVYIYGGMECQGYHYQWSELRDEPNFEGLLDRMGHELMWQFTDESLEIKGINKFRVCGHQSNYGKNRHPRIFKDRAFIDTGCGFGAKYPVTALVYPGKQYLQSR